MRPQEHTKIVILADLGTMRAFRLSPPSDPLAPHKGPASIEEITLPVHEQNTDRPSRFPLGRNVEESVSMSPGENHHEQTEHEKRRIRFLSGEIENLLKKEERQPWCLAAPATINKRLLAEIDPETCAFLETNIKADLTHITMKELEERFLPTSANA